MSDKRSIWPVVGALLAAAAGCGGDEDRPERRFVYSLRNGAANAVLAFEVGAGGDLTELPGSPFATGGGGVTRAAIVSDHPLVADQDDRRLFAVNPGTGDISVFDIGEDGALLAVPGSPFPGGSAGNPVSLAVSGDVLYASFNSTTFEECVGCGYRGYRIGEDGALAPLAGSAIDLPATPVSFPVSVEFNPAGDVLVGLRFSLALDAADVNLVETFELDRETGLLSAAAGSPLETGAAASQPLSATFNPADPGQIFVGSSVNIPVEAGAVSTYSMSDDGRVTLMPGSPVASGEEKGTAWVAATSDGRQLYASNTFSDSISHFAVDEAGAPSLVEVVPDLEDETGEAPRAIVITRDDRFLYVLNGHGGEDGNGGSLVGFEIDGGAALTRLPAEPLRFLGEQPFGLLHVER